MYNLLLIVMGVFVLLGSNAEWYVEKTKSALGDFKVQDVLMHQYNSLYAKLTLKEAVALLLDSTEQYFLVIDHLKVVGTLHRNEIISAITIANQNTPISKIMNKDFITLSLKTPLEHIFLRPVLRKQGVIPVMKKGVLLGILDVENIYEFMAIHDSFLQKELFALKKDHY
jgi:predicted transcriptional regulator